MTVRIGLGVKLKIFTARLGLSVRISKINFQKKIPFINLSLFSLLFCQIYDNDITIPFCCFNQGFKPRLQVFIFLCWPLNCLFRPSKCSSRIISDPKYCEGRFAVLCLQSCKKCTLEATTTTVSSYYRGKNKNRASI